jgi:hypothetical protein
MSAPPASQGTLIAGKRNLGWVVGLCLAVFIAATIYALHQPCRPDPFKPATLGEKFLYPYEQNGFMRLPMVSGALRDIFVVPDSGHIWAVGSDG